MEPAKKFQIQWQALEYQHYDKSVWWYFTLFTVAVLITIFFVLVERDWFGAVTIVLLTLVIYGFARKLPEEVTVKLDHKGVHLNNIMFPYKQLKDFWVVHNDRHQTVNFNTVTYINRTIIVQLNGQDPEEIHSFLSQHLPEHPRIHETLAQRVSHKFKF